MTIEGSGTEICVRQNVAYLHARYTMFMKDVAGRSEESFFLLGGLFETGFEAAPSLSCPSAASMRRHIDVRHPSADRFAQGP